MSGFATHNFNDALRKGQLDRAQRSVDQLAFAGEADFKTHLALGDLAARLGYGKRALEAFEKSLRLRETPQALYGQGIVYNARGERTKAIASFEALYRLSPDHPRAALFLADAYAAEGRADRARALLGDALSRGGPRPDLKERLDKLERLPAEAKLRSETAGAAP